jgi:hypothetical protein
MAWPRHDGQLWISLWIGCGAYVRIKSFHAQDSMRSTQCASCRPSDSPRSFSRSTGVPAQAGAAGFERGRAMKDGGRFLSARTVPRQPGPPTRLSLGKRTRTGCLSVRRLLRIGSQAGSRGVRRCLAGHSARSFGTTRPDASFLRRSGIADQSNFAPPCGVPPPLLASHRRQINLPIRSHPPQVTVARPPRL